MPTRNEPLPPADAGPVERPVSRLYADAIDADRLARGEAPKAELTDRRVFDDDIEVERCDCLNACGDDPRLKTGKVRKCDGYAFHNPPRCPMCRGSGYVSVHDIEAWELNGSNPNPPEWDQRA